MPLISLSQIDLKKELPSISTVFLAGMCEGGAETLKFHYYKVKNKYPNLNETYWNPEVSWTNKYKNGDVKQGPRFFGSTTFLVWTTDGYHMLRTSRNIFFITTLTLNKNKDKKKWYDYLIKIGTHTLAYQAGFHTTYTLMFK